MTGERLDVFLTQRQMFPSRARAQAAIAAGLVEVDGRIVRQAGARVGAAASVKVLGDAIGYVGRGGLKLAAVLDRFRISVSNRICMDTGAATGGFTDVLLQRGARAVYAIDVGRDQLHPELRRHPRVVVLEQTDVRRLACLPPLPQLPTQPQVPPLPPEDALSQDHSTPPSIGPTLATVDVAFISLSLVLPHIRRLAPAADLVALVKPQFEAGRQAVGRGGIVRDPRDRERALGRVLAAAAALGWGCQGVMPSPISGGDGNLEYLGYWTR